MKFNYRFEILKKAYIALSEKNPLRMAGATAFFTTFALPPILIILIQALGLFLNAKTVEEGVFTQLIGVLGKESSISIYDTLNQFENLVHNWLIIIAGFIFLLFVVTTLFNVVRKSVNEIWCIAVDRRLGIGFNLKLRLKSLIVIALAGLLLVVQLAASALQALLKNYIDEVWNGHNFLLYKIITQLIFLIIVTGWFTILFKYLANAHPDWRTAFTGGVFTGILFTIGKIILGLLLTFSNLRTIFGASGSFVLILLFVFYSSFIFYYGAAFTIAWADANNRKLRKEMHVHSYTIERVQS